MTDWAKIIAETPAPDPKMTAEEFLDQAFAQVNAPSVGQYGKLKELLGPCFIGPEEIKQALQVSDLGAIPALPKGWMEALGSDSLITPGQNVFQDHTLMLMPLSFDGVANTVLNFKDLVELAEQRRKLVKPGIGPVFYQDQKWYLQGRVNEERWAQAPLTQASWVLTPNIVPDDTRETKYAPQDLIISSKYQDYQRGSAQELIQFLALTELLTSERRYPSGSWGWTSTPTDAAGAYPGQFVSIGRFDADGFGVAYGSPARSDSALGAFLGRKFLA